MALNAGEVYVRVGARFDKSGFDRFDRAYAKAKAYKDVEVNLRTDERGLDRLDKAMQRIGDKTVHVRVETERQGLDDLADSTERVGRASRETRQETDAGGRSLRAMGQAASGALPPLGRLSLSMGPLSGRLSAITGSLGVLGPMLLALVGIFGSLAGSVGAASAAFAGLSTAAAGAFGPILAVGIGAVVRFGKVLDAYKAQQAAADSATKDTTTALESQRARMEAVRNAGNSLRDARQQVTRSERDYAEAVKQTRQELEDARRAQREATDDVRKAREEYERAPAGERVAALERLEEAEERLADQRKRTSELEDQGVKKNPRVLAAAEAQRDANEALTEAAHDLTAARRSGAAAAEKESAAQHKVGVTMGKLTKIERDLLKLMHEVVDAAKDTMLPATDAVFGGMITGTRRLLPTFRSFRGEFKELGDEIGDLFERAGRSLSGRTWRRALQELMDGAKRLTPIFGDTFGEFAEIIRNVAVLFMPHLVRGMKDVRAQFQSWERGTRNTEEHQEVVRGLVTHFRSLVRLLAAVTRLAITFFGLGADQGKGMVDNLTEIVNKWNEWMQTEEGRKSVREFFRDAADFMGQLARLLGPALATVYKLSRALMDFVDAIGGVKLLGVLLGGYVFAKMTGFLALLRTGIKLWKAWRASALAAAGASTVAAAAPAAGAGAGAAAGAAGAATAGMFGIDAARQRAAGAAAGGAAGGGFLSKFGAVIRGGLPKLLGRASILAAVGFEAAKRFAQGMDMVKAFARGDVKGGLKKAFNFALDSVPGARIGFELGKRIVGGVRDAFDKTVDVKVKFDKQGTIDNWRREVDKLTSRTDAAGLRRLADRLRDVGDVMPGLRRDFDKLADDADKSARRLNRTFRRVAVEAFSKTWEAEFRRSRTVTSANVAGMLKDLDKLPPGSRRRAAKAMIEMAKELREKGVLSREEFEKLKDAGIHELETLRRGARRKARRTGRQVVEAFKDMNLAVGGGWGKLGDAFNKILDGFGLKGKSTGIFGSALKLLKNMPGMNQSGEGATGWIGRPGQRGRDDRYVKVAGGEVAIATRHQQEFINSALRSTYGTDLRGLIKNVDTPHWAPRGGRGARSFERGGYVQGARPPSGPGGAPMRGFANWLFGQGFNATSGGEYRGSGTFHDQQRATDWGDSANDLGKLWRVLWPKRKGLAEFFGPWGSFEYGQRIGQVANHGDHIHIAILKALSGMAAGGDMSAMAELQRVVLTGPKGPLRDLGQKLLDQAREAANKKLNEQAASAGPGGEVISGTGSGMELMKSISEARGWNFADWWELDRRETTHGANLENPHSSARLRGQFMDFNYGKYGPGSDPAKNPSMDEQIISMSLYIADRYGNPTAAVRHHDANNWYEKGGVISAETGLAPEAGASGKDPTWLSRSVGAGGKLTDSGTRLIGRLGKRIPGLDELIEREERRYGQVERRYGLSEETFVIEPGDAGYDPSKAPGPGKAYIDQGALKHRGNEITELMKIRRRIGNALAKRRNAIEQIVTVYRRAVKRVARALKAAKKKKRPGLRKLLRRYTAASKDWTAQLRDAKFSVEDARLDRLELKGEYDALDLPGGGKALLPFEEGEEGDAASDDSSALAEQLQRRLDIALRGEHLARSALDVFGGIGDIGAGAQTALRAAAVPFPPAGPGVGGFGLPASSQLGPGGVDPKHETEEGYHARGAGPTVVIQTLHPGDPATLAAIASAANKGNSNQGGIISPRERTGA